MHFNRSVFSSYNSSKALLYHNDITKWHTLEGRESAQWKCRKRSHTRRWHSIWRPARSLLCTRRMKRRSSFKQKSLQNKKENKVTSKMSQTCSQTPKVSEWFTRSQGKPSVGEGTDSNNMFSLGNNCALLYPVSVLHLTSFSSDLLWKNNEILWMSSDLSHCLKQEIDTPRHRLHNLLSFWMILESVIQYLLCIRWRKKAAYTIIKLNVDLFHLFYNFPIIL